MIQLENGMYNVTCVLASFRKRNGEIVDREFMRGRSGDWVVPGVGSTRVPNGVDVMYAIEAYARMMGWDIVEYTHEFESEFF